jgi:hypothetical protein
MQQILRPTVKQLSVGCVVRSLTTGTRYWAVEKQLQTMPLEELWAKVGDGMNR